eukprot:1678730-Amphidinium_carterae.4
MCKASAYLCSVLYYDWAGKGVGGLHSCAFNVDFKCWGLNTYGQLGYGNAETIGDDVGEMGDRLQSILLSGCNASSQEPNPLKN